MAVVIFAPIPNGEMMIVNLRYNKITGMLQSLGNFTLAEGNHLVDEVVITSTDPDRESYNYVIEFCLYNYKHIPKTQYISPILKYTNRGICFTIPNQLTQVPGYVTAQITGYQPNSNEVVFKSIAKNAVCFWVEESHKVLESELSQTPNVLTHLMQELDELKEIKKNFVEDFSAQIKNDMGVVLEGYEYCKVEWVYYDHTEVQIFKKNSLLPKPKLNLPNGCENRGWIEEKSCKTWDFVFDRVQESIRLVQSFSSHGLGYDDNMVTNYSGKESEIYLAYSNAMITTTTIGAHVFDQVKNARIHLQIATSDIGALSTANIVQVDGGKGVMTAGGVLYMDGGKTLVKCMSDSSKITVLDGCEKILARAFEGRSAEEILLPDSVKEIENEAFANMLNLTQLVLGEGVRALGDNLVKSCARLTKVQCLAVNPPTMSSATWAVSSGNKVPIYVLGNVKDDYMQVLGKYGCTINAIGSEFASKNAVDNLQKAVENNSKNIAKNTSSISGINAKVSSLESSTGGLATRITAVESATKNCNTKLDEHDKKMAELSDKITQQTTKNNSQDEEIVTCKNGINSLNTKVENLENNSSVIPNKVTAIETKLANFYKVGSIYMSLDNTSPASLFGGTWEKIEGKFLLGASGSYAVGSSGGESTHTLTVSEMPSHTHDYYRMKSGGTTWWVSGSSGTIFDQTYEKTNATGGGKAHNNMPPYLAVNIWRRAK